MQHTCEQIYEIGANNKIYGSDLIENKIKANDLYDVIKPKSE
jgi:hypothetical protein